MLIQNIQQVRALFRAVPGTFVGAGMTAYSRIVPASFLETYHIIALHMTGDLPLLRRQAHVFCLEEAMSDPVPEKNSANLLAHFETRRFLEKLPGPKHFFLYQDYPPLRSAAKAFGWHLLANPPELRKEVGRRAFLEKLATDLGLPLARGRIHPINAVHQKGYDQWRDELGPAFVVQLPEIEQGGGRGTFFVHTQKDYGKLRERLFENRWRNTRLESVSVHRFLDGVPASVVVCVTRHGTLVSALQRQLLDLACCGDFTEDGVFCGHAWGPFPGSEAARGSAFDQACRIGDALGSMGYKGILGIDFIVSDGEEAVYPIEINPRLTGALPMLSLLHLKRGTVPMEAFHMLEFLEIPYEIDRDALNRRYAETVRGSHLLIFRSKGFEERGASLKPGLYKYVPENGDFRFVEETLAYEYLQDHEAFILADGPTFATEDGSFHGDSHTRLCRLLFRDPIVDANGNLTPRARLAAEWVRQETDGRGTP
jgi:hypothetical protein